MMKIMVPFQNKQKIYYILEAFICAIKVLMQIYQQIPQYCAKKYKQTTYQIIW